jgi:hypothetical protein
MSDEVEASQGANVEARTLPSPTRNWTSMSLGTTTALDTNESPQARQSRKRRERREREQRTRQRVHNEVKQLLLENEDGQYVIKDEIYLMH